MPAIKGRFKLSKPLIFGSAALIVFILAALSYHEKGELKEETVSYQDGIRELKRLDLKLEKNPSDLKALFERGRIRYFMGPSYWIDAAADLENAREKGFLDPMTFFYLGNIYSHLGFYDYAVEEFSRYLNNKGFEYKASLALGKAYYLKKDYPKALEIFENLRKESPSDLVAIENLILTKWRLGQDYSDSLLEMKNMSAKASCRADYLNGYIKRELKQWRESETSIQSAFAAGCEFELPDKTELLRILYEDYSSLKDYASALNALKETQRIGGLDQSEQAAMAELERKLSSSKKKNR